MKILITGASGLMGPALSSFLAAEGHEIGCLSRGTDTTSTPHWDPGTNTIKLGSFEDAEAIIHLAGENIASGRWSEAKKNRILHSRAHGTQLLMSHLAQLPQKPRVIISGSAVGYYGDCGDTILNESNPCGQDFLAGVCQQWEEATQVASESGIRVVNIRIGMVVTPQGGALQKMLLPFKLGLGGVIGNGNQYMSWVSLTDITHMIDFILSHDTLQGPVNLTSPHPVTNRQWTQILGRVLKRPTLLPMPAWGARLAFGEMADALLLSSTRALPLKLIDAGYTFKHPHVEATLETMLRRG